MRIRLHWFFTATILWIGTGSGMAQSEIYPTDYFRSPVDHQMRISGSFAELRPNHFHMGIDIKSKNRSSGDPILAAADGFVSRVKVQSGGYGNTIYIDHPNGYTTVYAHLQKFEDSLASFIQNVQYERETFEVDIDLEPGVFVFKKGQEIGRMGNSGRSYAPHLHFEIRETESEVPINPFLFGIKPNDDRAPDFRKVILYQLDQNKRVQSKEAYPLIGSASKRRIKGDTVAFPAWRVGIGVEAFDYMNGASNRNGIYELTMKVDNAIVFYFKLDKISFDHTRYLNAHIDYQERKETKKYFQKCFVQKGNQLPIYNQTGDHIVALYKDKPRKINIELRDVHGNTSEAEFYMKRDDDISLPPSKIYNYLLDSDSTNIISQENIKLIFPPNSLYEDLPLYLTRTESTAPHFCSDIYHIGTSNTPIHQSYQLLIKPTNSVGIDDTKQCLTLVEKKNKTSFGGELQNGFVMADINQLGPFVVYLDTIPPTITPLNFKENMRGKRTMTFKINDNLGTSGNASDLQYNAWIDDKWILMEYDAKNDKLTHRFQKSLPAGKHNFVLEVTDDRNNKTTFKSKFTR